MCVCAHPKRRGKAAATFGRSPERAHPLPFLPTFCRPPPTQEIAPPTDQGQRRLGYGLLLLPLLVLPPLPVDLILALRDMGSPTLF